MSGLSSEGLPVFLLQEFHSSMLLNQTLFESLESVNEHLDERFQQRGEEKQFEMWFRVVNTLTLRVVSFPVVEDNGHP